MPPPQRNNLSTESSRPSLLPRYSVLRISAASADSPGSAPLALPLDPIVPCVPGDGAQWSRRRRSTTTSECCRRITLAPLSWLLFLVLFVFVSCVVPLSTPSSTHVSTIATTVFGNESFPNGTLTVSSSGEEGEEGEELCPTARKWITDHGWFCFTLRNSTFIRNVTELGRRERRAIDMFCELDRILEKVDCAQPYSVNVGRRQCWLCREAYRDWVCAMTTDTLEDGRMDCEGGVMPCPSCASICHQVMRLCPYLTPDRVQFDELGGPTTHVSQYGGHPAFYCPLENIHDSDPAYTSECSKNQIYAHNDPDYVHNLCAADARFMRKRSAAVDTSNLRDQMTESTILHYSTCCWTYYSSLVDSSDELEEGVRKHNSTTSHNRIILNCCDEAGNCDSSDPDAVNAFSNSSSSLKGLGAASTTLSSPESPVRSLGSTQRTANNQVRGEDGTFRELSNAYQHDEGIEDEEDDDEEYYEDSSSSAGEIYGSSGASSNEVSSRKALIRRNNRFYMEESSSSVISIHRDNKIYSTRESRSVHDTFYIHDETNSASSAAATPPQVSVVMGNLVGCVICVIIPPLVSCLLVTCSLCELSRLCSFVIVEVVIGAIGCCHSEGGRGLGIFVLAFRIVIVFCVSLLSSDESAGVNAKSSSTTTATWVPITTTNERYLADNKRSSDRKTMNRKKLNSKSCCSRHRCSCCESILRFLSNYSNLLMNLPINNITIKKLRLSHRKLVVNHVIIRLSRRYYHVVICERNQSLLCRPVPYRSPSPPATTVHT